MKALIIPTVLLGMTILAHVSTAEVSKDLQQKRADWAAKQALVEKYSSTVHQLEFAVKGMQYRQKLLNKDYHALDDLQQNAKEGWEQDVLKQRLKQALKVYETIDTIANIQTLNLKKVVQDKVMDYVADNTYGKLMEINGCRQEMIDLKSQSSAQLPQMAKLRAALGADIDLLKKMTTADALFIEEKEGLLLRQHELVDGALTDSKSAISRINNNLKRAMSAAQTTIDELRPQWIAVHEEATDLETELLALEATETEALEEVIHLVVDEMSPIPPPDEPAPELPAPDPEVDPLEVYNEWYAWGTAELDYYIPDWIETVRNTNDAIATISGEIVTTLEESGMRPSSTLPYSLGLLASVPHPDHARLEPSIDPATPPGPARLVYLAENYHRYRPLYNFYTLSAVETAYNRALHLTRSLRPKAATIEAMTNNLMSMEAFAEGVDAYWEYLGLHTEYNEPPNTAPPSDQSVYLDWLEYSDHFGGMNLGTVVRSEAELEFEYYAAYAKVSRMRKAVPIMKETFDEKMTLVEETLGDLNTAIDAYVDAYQRAETAVAAYDAALQASVFMQDRYEVNYFYDLEGNYKADLEVLPDLWPLNDALQWQTDAEARTLITQAKGLLIALDGPSYDYHGARNDMLAAWDLIRDSYDLFHPHGGEWRVEWQALMDQLDLDPTRFPHLRIPTPDFSRVEMFESIYNDGDNLNIAGYAELKELPVPDVAMLDEVVDLLNESERMMTLSWAWANQPAKTVGRHLYDWQSDHLEWMGERTPEWNEIFGDWANGLSAFIREDVVNSHAWEQGDPAAPTITQQPASVRIAPGQPATFSIEIEGDLYIAEWGIYESYAGSSFLFTALPNNFHLDVTTTPLYADTQFICRVKWGAFAESKDQVIYSDVVQAQVDDDATQEFAESNLEVPTVGGDFSVFLTSENGDIPLDWVSQTSATWLKVPWKGRGNGPFAIEVEPNLTGVPRTGTITVGGTVLTVRQQFERESYEDWRQRHYPDVPHGDPKTAPDGDANGNGVPNLLEHIVGLADMPTGVAVRDWLTIEPSEVEANRFEMRYAVSKLSDVDAATVGARASGDSLHLHSTSTLPRLVDDTETHWIYAVDVPAEGASAVFAEITAELPSD